jgi:SAM-dependent methyltransferase
MNRKTHWERIHTEKEPQDLTWHQESPTVAVQLLESAGATLQSPVIDVGGGTARFVDHLVTSGYEDVTVLDVSSVALDYSRKRLGRASERVQWIVADVLDAEFPQTYEIWHDRAVFHFLTDPGERRRYANKLYDALTLGGHAIIATFAEDGPERCSGLPCVRYSPKALHAELGADKFRLVDSARETHTTPRGQEQRFQYSLLQKMPIA